MPPSRIDRHALHEYLWKNTDRAGRIRINQTNLAADLAIDRITLYRIMTEFIAAGRIRKMSESGRSVLYQVFDPASQKWNR